MKALRLKWWAIVLISLGALIIIGVSVVAIVYSHYLNKIDRISHDETMAVMPDNEIFETEKPLKDGETEFVIEIPTEIPDDPEKFGIYIEDGVKYYYENGLKTYAGLFSLNGYWLYANSDGEIVTGKYRIIKTNGFMKAGFYYFDSNGCMVNPPVSPNGDTVPTGPAETKAIETTRPAERETSVMTDTPTTKDTERVTSGESQMTSSGEGTTDMDAESQTEAEVEPDTGSEGPTEPLTEKTEVTVAPEPETQKEPATVQTEKEGTAPQQEPETQSPWTPETAGEKIPGGVDLYDDGLYNILLVGENGDDKNSDTMMIVSINFDRQMMSVISLQRDTYVTIPGGYSNNKLNSAFLFGSFKLLMETIKYNFDIDIDACVGVDFSGFENIINSFGGVEINITEKEATKIPGTVVGKNQLNGEQALTYARLRSIDNDFIRTSRQRNIIAALFKQIRKMSLSEISTMLDTVLPYVSTDLTNLQITNLLIKFFPILTKVQVNNYYVPYLGAKQCITKTINGMWVIVPDLDAVNDYLWNKCLPVSK